MLKQNKVLVTPRDCLHNVVQWLEDRSTNRDIRYSDFRAAVSNTRQVCSLYVAPVHLAV